MSPNRKTKPSWKNRQWKSAISLHVLQDQIYAGTQSVGLWRTDAPKGPRVVRRWDQSATDRPSFGSSSSYCFVVGTGKSRSITQSAGSRRSQSRRNGRTLHFHRREKKPVYIITIVDRATRCFLSYKVVWERTQVAIQDMVDEAVKAKRYHSDAFDAYDRLWYHYGSYEVSEGKTDTYSVEGDNAELRHYLARLARRSCC